MEAHEQVSFTILLWLRKNPGFTQVAGSLSYQLDVFQSGDCCEDAETAAT